MGYRMRARTKRFIAGMRATPIVVAACGCKTGWPECDEGRRIAARFNTALMAGAYDDARDWKKRWDEHLAADPFAEDEAGVPAPPLPPGSESEDDAYEGWCERHAED